MSDASEYEEHEEVDSENSAESRAERSEEEIEDEIEAEAEDDNEEVEAPFDIKSVSDYNKEIHIIPADERMTRNNNCLVDISGLNDPRLMARRELMEGKCPLYVRRRVDTGDGVEQYYEIWDPNTMAFATVYTDI
mgnify:CR=1 FL=1